MRGPRAVAGFGLVWALWVCAPPGLAALPEPEELYRGSAPGLQRGILVARDTNIFDLAIEPLDPGYGGPVPDFTKRTVLRVIGAPLVNSCRDTRLLEVSTRFSTATVRIEELIPEEGCVCQAEERPPVAWLISVARMVKKAELQVTDRVVPCPLKTTSPIVAQANPVPVLLMESSWEESPGAKLLASEAEYREVLKRLGAGERGPSVDFKTSRVTAVTGRPRENSCRRTNVVGAKLTGPEEAEFTLEETYPAKGQLCAQVFSSPVVFLYRVPSTVVRVRTVTLEKR